jgi:hypothetical protein
MDREIQEAGARYYLLIVYEEMTEVDTPVETGRIASRYGFLTYLLHDAENELKEMAGGLNKERGSLAVVHAYDFNRVNFTVALLCARIILGFPGTEYVLSTEEVYRPTGSKSEFEMRAFDLATRLTMPESHIDASQGRREMSETFGVPRHAVSYRLRDLGIRPSLKRV